MNILFFYIFFSLFTHMILKCILSFYFEDSSLPTTFDYKNHSICYVDNKSDAVNFSLDLFMVDKYYSSTDSFNFITLENQKEKEKSIAKEECDVYLNVSSERKGYVKTKPYYSYPAVMFSNFSPHPQKNFGDYSVGFIYGYDTIGAELDFKYILYYENYQDMADALNAGELDFAIISKRNFHLYYLSGLFFSGYYKSGWSLSFLVKDDQPELISRLGRLNEY